MDSRDSFSNLLQRAGVECTEDLLDRCLELSRSLSTRGLVISSSQHLAIVIELAFVKCQASLDRDRLFAAVGLSARGKAAYSKQLAWCKAVLGLRIDFQRIHTILKTLYPSEVSQQAERVMSCFNDRWKSWSRPRQMAVGFRPEDALLCGAAFLLSLEKVEVGEKTRLADLAEVEVQRLDKAAQALREILSESSSKSSCPDKSTSSAMKPSSTAIAPTSASSELQSAPLISTSKCHVMDSRETRAEVEQSHGAAILVAKKRKAFEMWMDLLPVIGR